jgi:hypothetical protein
MRRPMNHVWTKYLPSTTTITTLSILGIILAFGFGVWDWGA